MFHSLFVLIYLKVDSVFFKFPCLSRISDILSLSNKIHRLGHQHPWLLVPAKSTVDNPFYGVQVPSFLSFKADGNVINETVARGVTVSFQFADIRFSCSPHPEKDPGHEYQILKWMRAI
jgi:hypothetical protein